MAEAITWVAFWAFLAFALWCDYRTFETGLDGIFLGHKTPAELRRQEAMVRKLEAEAELLHLKLEDELIARGRLPE